jgi:hypothetical protein
VEPLPSDSRVTLLFEAVRRFGPLGRSLLRLMGRRARGELEAILDAYERTATRGASAQAA